MDSRLLENRPTRQFINQVKSIISESEPVLKAYGWHYRTARIKLDILRAAIQDIDTILLKAEENRPFFICDDLIAKNCNASAERVNELSTMIDEIKDDSARKRWEAELTKLASQLHLKRIENMQTNDIDTFRSLRIADKRLLELKAQAEQAAFCCIKTNKGRLLDQQVELQESVIENLEQTLDQRKTTPEIERLKEQYDQIRIEVQYQIDHKDDMLFRAEVNLENAEVAHQAALEKVSRAETAYYANISPQEMHGLLRIYERFQLYMDAYKSNIKNFEEAKPYLDRLNACHAKLDELIKVIWCEQYNKLSAREIYWQFKKLQPELKDKFLVALPDREALTQIIGKLNLESTADKRGYLKRTTEGVNGKVIFKI